MKAAQKNGPLLKHIDEIESLCAKTDPTLKDIFTIFGSEGHFVLIFFLILPFLQPIPVPGLSTIFGILIASAACLHFLKYPAWLPKRWSQKTLPAQTVLKIANASESVFKKLSFLHPRLSLFFAGPFRSINVVLIVVNALLLALPLPIPFSNSIPAWTIAFQAVAHLEEDGLLVIFSYISSCLSFGFFAFIALQAGRLVVT